MPHQPWRSLSFSTLPCFVAFAALAASPCPAGVHFKTRGMSDGTPTVETEVWRQDNSEKRLFLTTNPIAAAGDYTLTTDGGETTYLVRVSDRTYQPLDLGELLQQADKLADIEITNLETELVVEEPGEEILGMPTIHTRHRTSYSMEVKVLGLALKNLHESTLDIWATEVIQEGGSGVWAPRPPSSENAEMDALLTASRPEVRGWPLKAVEETRTTSSKGDTTLRRSITEVYELVEAELDESLFSVPAEYREVTTAALPTVATTEDRGDVWRIDHKLDPMTDQEKVTARRRSMDDQAALVVVCDAGQISIYVDWNEYLADNTWVTTRFDQAEPEASLWAGSRDDTATFVPEKAEGEFLQRLVASRKLAARIRPYRQSDLTVVFLLEDADEALEPLRQRCPAAGRGRKAIRW